MNERDAMNGRDIGRFIIPGRASGPVLHAEQAISFWMGVDPNSGEIIDRHHRLCGASVAGKILVLPGGRGSCAGSCGILELIVGECAPAALILRDEEPILTLGALIANEFFGKDMPIACVGEDWYGRLASAASVVVEADRLVVPGVGSIQLRSATSEPGLRLSDSDRSMLDGVEGPARAAAMLIVSRFAELVGARELVDVAQAHVDCCFYTGPAGLAFAERLARMKGRVKVPTTTNAASVDARRWRAQGIDPVLARRSARVADAYVGMGARASFTCAPYLLDSAPSLGQQIAWGESNAVAYANSVLGARTMKYPDMLDACVALTGRAPLTATHTEEARRPRLLVDVLGVEEADESLYPLLGYHVGLIAGQDVTLLDGLSALRPTTDDLKAFSAAYATTSGSPMFHMVGITPEAPNRDDLDPHGELSRRTTVTREDLQGSWRELDAAEDCRVGLVSLGNPHFSLTEFARTAALCHGRSKAGDIRLVITCGRYIHERARRAGYIHALKAFGAEVLNDTCWCMVDDRQVAGSTGTIMTNSAKFAHYGPGITGRPFHFGSLAACVEAACTGRHEATLPRWLQGDEDTTVALES